jgi:hypothetical protein
MRLKFFTFLLFLAFTGIQFTLSAQTLMHWDTHGVAFTVPDNFKIITNNAEEYSAENRNLSLTIVPVQDEEVTSDNLKEALTIMAKEMDYDSIEKMADAQVQDFEAYYMIGKKDGVKALLMAMLDTESSTNLLVVIVYKEGHEDTAIDIANSFEAYDE